MAARCSPSTGWTASVIRRRSRTRSAEVEVGGQLDDRLLAEGVRPTRRPEEEPGVASELRGARSRLRAEADPAGHLPGQLLRLQEIPVGGVHREGGQNEPLRMLRSVGALVHEPGEAGPAHGAQRIEVERVGHVRRDRLIELGDRSSQDARDVEEAPRPRPGAPLEQLEERRPGRLGPLQLLLGQRREEVEQLGGRPALLDVDRRLEGEEERCLRVGRTGVGDLPAADGHPGRPVFPVGAGRTGSQSDEPQPQERRRDERRHEDHDEQGGVDVVTEHALLQADGGEDEADLAAGDHAEAHEQAVPRRTQEPSGGDNLADHRDGEQRGRHAEHLGVEEALDLSIDADLEEEHRDEEVADRGEVRTDAVRRAATGQRHAGHERPHDRRQLCCIGQLGHGQGKGEGQGHQGSSGAADPPDGVEERRDHPHPDGQRCREEDDRDHQDLDHLSDLHRSRFGEPYDDGQDDEAEDVVGHRRAEHGPRFHRGEGPEVTEDPGADPDARGGERGADEDRLVGAEAEQEADACPGREGHDHADERDGERGPSDRSELPEVHLEADVEEEQDHAQLGEHAQHVAVAHQAEQRRADQDACDDLPDHGREPDPLRHLGRDLCRDQDHQDVEQRAQRHRMSLPS